MFHAGDQIENPVTGERLVFHETSSETGGERVVFETIVQPGGFVAAAHFHPLPDRALRGARGHARDAPRQGEGGASRRRDGRRRAAARRTSSGTRATTRSRFVCTVTPALQFERLIATMYSLAADGKTNKKGMPNPLRLAVIANHHFDDVRLPLIPQSLQKLALAMGAPAGRHRRLTAPPTTRCRASSHRPPRDSKRLLIGVLVPAALVLAVGGWIVDGSRSILKP